MKKILLFIFFLTYSFGFDIRKIYLSSYNYEKMQDYKDAIKVLIPLYKQYPKTYTINLRLGWLFFLQRNYKNAIFHYKQALLMSPSSIEAYIGLLRSYIALNDYNNAIPIGNTILKIDFYNFYGNYYLALALIAKNNYKEAKTIINKMLRLYPTNVLYLELLANILVKEKNPKAKKIYQEILILDPNNISANRYIKEGK